ncbi:glycoside hydrolase family 25 protein [Qipengyuania sediminis]|uniref:glycoside hydrolase family 25 protein n=1 Tax=Qipengyuania sediminis TaxID=1532023 RepID=UPI00105A6B31|nr:glycoside hydrolase family 25 protein [Qipengyuania sediminis]
MAKRSKNTRAKRWRWALLALVLAAGATFLWWQWTSRSWRPDETAWPEQGVLAGEGDGAVRFAIVRGLGGSFAYLEASRGAAGRDRRFGANLAAARAEGLAVGAVHVFDPCTSADRQSANFVIAVPRDPALLPPAILLEAEADFCPEPVSEAAIQSELMTLVNQIEAHAGKPAILAPSEAFERRYRAGARIERRLWLARDRAEPTYAGRPWSLWTANARLQTEASDGPLRWVVARP